jgi:hypothetical protein
MGDHGIASCQQSSPKRFTLVTHRFIRPVQERLVFRAVASHGRSLPPERLRTLPSTVSLFTPKLRGFSGELADFDLHMRLVEFHGLQEPFHRGTLHAVENKWMRSKVGQCRTRVPASRADIHDTSPGGIASKAVSASQLNRAQNASTTINVKIATPSTPEV